jgi:hypothetical protein
MKTKILTTMLVLFLAVAMIPAAYANKNGPLHICKTVKCPFGEDDPDTFTTNTLDLEKKELIWPMETKIVVWLRIHVRADEGLDEVVVRDRLGAEWMIEGIVLGDNPGKDKDPAQDGTMDFEFNYTGGDHPDPEVGDDLEIAYYDNGIKAQGWSTTLTKKIEIMFDDFTVLLTGNSLKAHFMWRIGRMEAGESRTIFLVISSDHNPGGKQEFTSPGEYLLNSGAVVKALNEDGKKVVDETESIFFTIIKNEE